jgi:hypothetical protein
MAEHEHNKPKPDPEPVKPEPEKHHEKTAGDYRKEDAEAVKDQTQQQKEGVQKEADDKAMQDYKAEQVEKFPPEPSDPLKDREARRADEKKHEAPKEDWHPKDKKP